MGRQFLGFLLAGTCATIVHYSVLIFCVELILIGPVTASSLGVIAGATTGFYINRNFVFKNNASIQIAFIKYLIMAGFSALINIIIVWFSIYILHFYYLIAQIIATISMILYNFTCCRRWIFKET